MVLFRVSVRLSAKKLSDAAAAAAVSDDDDNNVF